MGKLWMPVSNFKKIHEDDQKAVLQHPDGHQVTLAKNILSPAMRQQLQGLPIHKMARGGKVTKYDDGGMAGGPGCGADGQMTMGGQPSGQPNPQAPQAPQPSAPGNPQIQQAQQAPMQDPQGQGMPGVFGGKSPVSLMNQGFNQQLQGAKAGMNAQQAGAGQVAQAVNSGVANLQDDLNKFYHGWQGPDGRPIPGYLGRLQEIDAVKQDILTNHIDPNRFIESGALPKVMTAIGLLGTMANSHGGGRAILGFMNDQMNRDIQAQMADKSGKVNVLQANLQQLGNMRDAIQMTSAQHQAMMSALLEKAAATTNSGMAKANYLQLAGQIHQNMAKQVYDWTMGGLMGQKVGAGGGAGQGAQGQQGGAQAGGAAPTDAVGNPLPQGMPINPGFYKGQNPVALSNNTYGFAYGPEQQKTAQNAMTVHDQINDALKDVVDQQKQGMSFGPTGIAAKQGAVDKLNAVVKGLAAQGKLSPQQAEALMNMAKIAPNPLPGFLGRNQAEQKVKDLGQWNNDNMNDTLKNNVQQYVPPAKPKNGRGFAD